jgi:hypothetical protein
VASATNPHGHEFRFSRPDPHLPRTVQIAFPVKLESEIYTLYLCGSVDLQSKFVIIWILQFCGQTQTF